jgi:hypothetical protein
MDGGFPEGKSMANHRGFMGISGSKNGGTVPYFWPYFVGIFPYIGLV